VLCRLSDPGLCRAGRRVGREPRKPDREGSYDNAETMGSDWQLVSQHTVEDGWERVVVNDDDDESLMMMMNL
jgi:hypothetical protein